MDGKVILRAWNPPGEIGFGGGFEVLTAPALRPFLKRFWRGNASDPFAQAVGFASTSAAALGWELVDETGRLPPEMIAPLVAEQARKGGASIVPIGEAMLRRAERAG